MRRVSLLGIVAALPLAALAQDYPQDNGFNLHGGAFGLTSSSVSLSIGFKTNGWPLPERATTISHITFNDTTYVDSIAATAPNWTTPTPKTPDSASVSPFYPGKAGLSAVASSNRIAYATGTDPGDVVAFWGCAVVLPTSTAAKQCFLGNGDSTTTGYHGCMEIGGACSLQAGTGTVTTANTMVVNGPNVCCYGRDTAGTTGYVQLNGGTVASGAVSNSTDVSRPLNMISGNAGTQPWANGTIYEHIMHSETWDATGALDSFKAVFGISGFSHARSTVGTVDVNGLSWVYPPATPRINDSGILIERALAANLHPSPSAPAAGAVTFTATGQHYFSVIGTGSQQLSFNTATGSGLPCTATAASPCSFTVTGTGSGTLAAVTGSLTCAQVEAGATRTTCTPAANRGDDEVNIAWPAGLADYNRWCLRVAATPYGGQAWGISREFFSVGAAAAANTTRGIIASPFTSISFRIYDSGAVLRNASAVHGFADGSTHTLSFVNNNGVNSWLDGTVTKATAGTTGTGLWNAAPASMTIGGVGTTGYVDAFLKNFTFYKDPKCR